MSPLARLRDAVRGRHEERESVEALATRLSSTTSELERATLDLRLTIDRLQGVKTFAGGQE